MESIINLGAQLGAVGFPTLLLIMLVGNYYEVWVWGRQKREVEINCQKQLAELEENMTRQLNEAKADAREWKSVALQGLGILETASQNRRE